MTFRITKERHSSFEKLKKIWFHTKFRRIIDAPKQNKNEQRRRYFISIMINHPSDPSDNPTRNLKTMTGASALSGRFGDISSGLSLEGRWQPGIFHGHLGRFVDGLEVELKADHSGLNGRAGSFTQGFEIKAKIAGETLNIHLGSFTEGIKAQLDFTHESANGHYGPITTSHEISMRHYDSEVRGHVGGYTNGQDFRMDLGNVPLPVGAMLAICAHHALQIRLLEKRPLP